MKLDKDIKTMSAGKARQELQRVRNRLRWHRNTDENARCWHNDVKLYGDTLPEAKPAGRMDQPKYVLLRRCEHYIDRQQCAGLSCPISKPRGQKAIPQPTIATVPGAATKKFRWPTHPHPGGIRKHICPRCHHEMSRKSRVKCFNCGYDLRKK